MARKSKLSDSQWGDIQRRLVAGEPIRALAREYDVSDTAIRNRKSLQVEEIKDVANQIVSTHQAVSKLSVTSQRVAQTLADKLITLSDNLLGAAMEGAATAHRLNAIANGMVQKVDDAAPLESMASLKAVHVLTKIANDASHIGLNLVAANKGNMPPDRSDAPGALPADVMDAAIEYQKYMG